MKKISAVLMVAIMIISLCSCGSNTAETPNSSSTGGTDESSLVKSDTISNPVVNQNTNNIPENFVMIQGGTFQMGSPTDEAWRSEDETQHTVTVSDFYMSIYELPQAEYQEGMGVNPG